MTDAREVIEQCHRDWRGFWPRGFAEDLEKRIAAAGLVIVPKEPTNKMLRVGIETYNKPLGTVARIYGAMVEAATDE